MGFHLGLFAASNYQNLSGLILRSMSRFSCNGKVVESVQPSEFYRCPVDGVHGSGGSLGRTAGMVGQFSWSISASTNSR